MTDLTSIAISALVASPITMAMAAVVPQFAWLLGAVLMLLGIASAASAYLDYHDLKGYVVGLIAFVFGVATELASIEGLVYLTIFAVVVDALIGVIERYG